MEMHKNTMPKRDSELTTIEELTERIKSITGNMKYIALNVVMLCVSHPMRVG